jgi:hypothetical protein
MVIDARVPEILERQRGKAVGRCGGCEIAALYLREKLEDGGARHDVFVVLLCAAVSAAC